MVGVTGNLCPLIVFFIVNSFITCSETLSYVSMPLFCNSIRVAPHAWCVVCRGVLLREIHEHIRSLDETLNQKPKP